MFSVTGASNKTSQLVDKIAEAINLELASDSDSGMKDAPSIAETEVYVISDSMTIPLADNGDGKDHYFIVTVSLSLDTRNEDYETYETEDALKGKESLIKSEINSVISKYTLEYVKENQDLIREEILERLQAMYDSEFIYGVTFSDPLYS